ncbi:zinc finger protein 839 isoform X1 [Oncorhynchus nerka]|uniref:zinc finger protein 839 isoform X1 n=1 Tax=Oncorhynchus nerka TaxID=8023 RepID=UPI0011328186|nr:zinc finger protein 839 isoform X1 [Oncorhynchus nerka]
MADNESNMSSTTTGADHVTVSQVPCVSGLQVNQKQVGEKCIEANAPEITEEQGLTDFLQSCTKEETFVAKDSQEVVSQTEDHEQQPEQNILTSIVETPGIATGAEYSTVSADFVNALAPGTTIIYVQPDGSFVEGSGLTEEEQQQLVEQLAKQQLITVTENEAAHLFEQNQGIKTVPTTSSQIQYTIPSTALAPNELQQVIEQVTKSQQFMAQTPKGSEQVVTTLDPTTGLFTTVAASEIAVASPQPLVTMQNASQKLKNVAKQVALQSHNGTRLVQKKQETIRIQVQIPSGKQEGKGPTQTTISIPQQKNLAVASQGQQVKVSTNGSVSNSPQIIHITPIVGQQQYFLQQNPGDPPIQLLLQSSTPVVGSLVPVVHKLPIPVQTPVQQPSGKVPVNGTTVTAIKPATSVSVPTVEKVKRVKTRMKKAPKIKTRSGRVSRPPKYKVKDYKFIKTEDLAESHQSDSDDYSEISVEEDEDGEDGKKGAASMIYSHKRKAFQCETCDKAYIGHGGLSRHYRLNPSHGELKSLPEGTSKTDSPDKSADAGDEHKKPTEESNASSVKNTSGPEKSEATEKTAAATTQQKADTTATQGVAASTRQAVVQARGPGRPRGRGRPPTKAHPAVRLGRPPKLGGGAASVEQQTQSRKAWLKEVTHECDNEELMETVLPRLAKVMTVWEFLLMKVEKGRQPKTQFSDVYREFEKLHSQVKKMAQDYISNPQGVHMALEVHNVEVAKSLGIVDEVNKFKVLNPPTQQNVTNMATKNVHYMENSKMLPPTKRFKMENQVGVQIHQNGIETSTKESSEAKVENTATTSMKYISPHTEVVTKSPVGPQVTQTATITPQVVSSNPETNITPMELIQDHLSNSMTETVDSVGEEAMETDQGVSGTEPTEVLSTSDIADQMKELEKALATDPVAVDQQPMSTQPQQSNPTPVQQSGLTQAASTSSGLGQVVVQEAQGCQEVQEIYIQTEGLTMHLAEGQEGELASERIVIVNGPDGTTMHIRAPEGVPLEAVHALLGIEAEGKTQQ